MRRLIGDVGIILGIMAAAMIGLAVVGASQSWRESTMFTAGALAGWIMHSRHEEEETDR